MKKQRIIGYDGYCNLCSWTVQWVIRNDPKRKFAFRPLQDPSLLRKLEEYALVPSRENDTVILILDGRIFQRSAAVLRIAARLRFPWPLAAVFFIVPAFIRDPLYNMVARNRKKWFGERSSCYIPD